MGTQVHWLAVLAAAVAAFAVGGVWYSALFGKLWMAARGLTAANLARELHARGHHLDLLAFADRPSDWADQQHYAHLFHTVELVPEPERSAADTLRHVGLYEERYRPIGGYSTGMKQRVKLAQALVHDPRLVLLDEPTNGLDPAGRDEILDLIRRIGNDFGISVLVTSHLLCELERIADHIVVIEGGVLQRSTSTAEATALSGVMLVEVTERGPDVVARLRAAGAQVEAADEAGNLFTLTEADEAVLDAVAAVAADLGVGLVRMQRRRHHLTEMFREGAA